MDSARPPARDSRFERACLAAAFAVTVAWFLVYDQFRPDYLVDESGHLGAIYHFLEHKPGWPEQMTMLPGYHYTVIGLWNLHPPLKLLTLARLVSTVFALGGLAAFAFAWRRLHGRAPGPATLVLALLPVLQPFTGMAYTDAPALACILAAFAAQMAQHRVIAGAGFAISALVRQTNLLWAAFVLPFEWWRAAAHRRAFLHRVTGIIFLLVLAALAVAFAGRITVGTQTGTELRPNIATLHAGALLLLLLGLPLWLLHLPAAGRTGLAAAKAHPLGAVVVSGAAVLLTVLLTRTFANPHPWNRELSWPDSTFTLLRNWPLVGMESSAALRVLSSANVVLMAGALWLVVRAQRYRRELAAAVLFGALLPLANNLVEPRYFIPGIAFFLLFLEVRAADRRWLTAWWALLCAAHAPFIARGLSLW